MRIFQLQFVEKCEYIAPIHDADVDLFEDLDGTPWSADWTPVEMEIYKVGDRRRRLRHADFLNLLGWALVLRDRAIDLAGPIVAPFGEILPLTCADVNVSLFNPLEILDALDESRSQIVRFPSSGRIMVIEKYVFRPEVIPERGIFRSPQEPTRPFFYSEPVADDLMNLGLTGLELRPVWDSNGV